MEQSGTFWLCILQGCFSEDHCLRYLHVGTAATQRRRHACPFGYEATAFSHGVGSYSNVEVELNPVLLPPSFLSPSSPLHQLCSSLLAFLLPDHTRLDLPLASSPLSYQIYHTNIYRASPTRRPRTVELPLAALPSRFSRDGTTAATVGRSFVRTTSPTASSPLSTKTPTFAAPAAGSARSARPASTSTRTSPPATSTAPSWPEALRS